MLSQAVITGFVATSAIAVEVKLTLSRPRPEYGLDGARRIPQIPGRHPTTSH
jgi:hypothetical protein